MDELGREKFVGDGELSGVKIFTDGGVFEDALQTLLLTRFPVSERSLQV